MIDMDDVHQIVDDKDAAPFELRAVVAGLLSELEDSKAREKTLRDALSECGKLACSERIYNIAKDAIAIGR